MKEGTIFTYIEISSEWPVYQNAQLYSSLMDDSNIQVTALPLGRLLIEVITEGQETIYFLSQEIEFISSKRMILTISWSKGEISVFINSNPISSSKEFVSHKVTSKPLIKNNETSINSKDKIIACKKWMLWRKHKYSQPKLHPKKGRRIKTNQEQIDELNKVINVLSDLVAFARIGNKEYIVSILPILRSLLFWADNSGSYNPLLIRVAGYLEMPLPIYALHKENTEQPKVLAGLTLQIINDVPQLIKRLPNQELMDFQDWLHSIALIDKENTYRVKDLIFEASNTISSAHFDDDIPMVIDLLRNNIGFNLDMLTAFTLNIAEVTIILGNYLLNKK